MELSTTPDATSCEATRELPSISWNPKAHYCIYKSSPHVPILIQTNPINIPLSYLSKIHPILSSYLERQKICWLNLDKEIRALKYNSKYMRFKFFAELIWRLGLSGV
jgi:hypothetical protein